MLTPSWRAALSPSPSVLVVPQRFSCVQPRTSFDAACLGSSPSARFCLDVRRDVRTAPLWARAVAPVAEWIARQLWTRQRKSEHDVAPPTRLTQSHKRKAKGSSFVPAPEPAPKTESLCRDCGACVGPGRVHCPKCAIVYSTDRLKHAAQMGRVASHTAEAEARRSETQRKHAIARYGWSPSAQPAWLTDEAYAREIQPRLARIANSAMASALGVSLYYAADIRRGRRRPHPRHWQALAQLAGIAQGE